MVLKPCLILFASLTIIASAFDPLPKQSAEQDQDEFFRMSPPELPGTFREARWRIPSVPVPENIDRLIEGLGAPSFSERTKAAADLRALGMRAGKPLLGHIRAEDPEVALSARRILKEITKDNAHHHLHLGLVKEVETGRLASPAKGEIKPTCDIPEVIFAMRTIVDHSRMSSLFKRVDSIERVEEMSRWLTLLSHRHGHPRFLENYLKRHPKFELDPRMQAYLERGAESDYPRLRAHCRKWAVAIGHTLPDGKNPLLSDNPTIRNVAAARLYKGQRKHLEHLAQHALASDEARRQSLGLEWLAFSVQGVYNHTSNKTGWRPEQVRLEAAAPFLAHESPGMRLRAAFAFIPAVVSYKPNEDSTKRVSCDKLLLTTTKATNLLAIADWLEASDPRPAFPGSLGPSFDKLFFEALLSYSPKHMANTLRVFARDLAALKGEARAAAIVDLAGGLNAFRFVQLSPSEWPSDAFKVLLEARMMQSPTDPFIYMSQEQFADSRPDFLLPAFEVGPIPPDRSYAMLAAASCVDDAAAIATLSKALNHPSAAHRTEAAMALSFLGEAAGRDAARSVLTNEAVNVSLRSKAAVALAELEDEVSYPDILAAFVKLVHRDAATNSENQKARTRFLYSLRQAKTKAVEDFVKMRLNTSRCNHCMHVAGRNYCSWCSRDKTAIKALAHHWKLLESIPKDLDADHDWSFVRFLLEEKPANLDFPEVDALLRVPAGKRVDLRLDAAKKIDALTGGITTFADIAKEEPDDLAGAYSTWRQSAAALPFLSKSAKEDLKLELEVEAEEKAGEAVPLER